MFRVCFVRLAGSRATRRRRQHVDDEKQRVCGIATIAALSGGKIEYGATRVIVEIL